MSVTRIPGYGNACEIDSNVEVAMMQVPAVWSARSEMTQERNERAVVLSIPYSTISKAGKTLNKKPIDSGYRSVYKLVTTWSL